MHSRKIVVCWLWMIILGVSLAWCSRRGVED